jgi:hypothetical protein
MIGAEVEEDREGEQVEKQQVGKNKKEEKSKYYGR